MVHNFVLKRGSTWGFGFLVCSNRGSPWGKGLEGILKSLKNLENLENLKKNTKHVRPHPGFCFRKISNRYIYSRHFRGWYHATFWIAQCLSFEFLFTFMRQKFRLLVWAYGTTSCWTLESGNTRWNWLNQNSSACLILFVCFSAVFGYLLSFFNYFINSQKQPPGCYTSILEENIWLTLSRKTAQLLVTTRLAS